MYSSISSNELKGLVGRANIIDIRDNYLYNVGSVPSAKNIPINFLLMDPAKYLDKNQTYYLYCSFGMQSAKACANLNSQGYKVVNVLGGYHDYVSKG